MWKQFLFLVAWFSTIWRVAASSWLAWMLRLFTLRPRAPNWEGIWEGISPLYHYGRRHVSLVPCRLLLILTGVSQNTEMEVVLGRWAQNQTSNTSFIEIDFHWEEKTCPLEITESNVTVTHLHLFFRCQDLFVSPVTDMKSSGDLYILKVKPLVFLNDVHASYF